MRSVHILLNAALPLRCAAPPHPPHPTPPPHTHHTPPPPPHTHHHHHPPPPPPPPSALLPCPPPRTSAVANKTGLFDRAKVAAAAPGAVNFGQVTGEQGLAGRQLAACAACTSSSTQPCPCACAPPPPPPPTHTHTTTPVRPPALPPPPHAHLQWPTRGACSTPPSAGQQEGPVRPRRSSWAAPTAARPRVSRGCQGLAGQGGSWRRAQRAHPPQRSPAPAPVPPPPLSAPPALPSLRHICSGQQDGRVRPRTHTGSEELSGICR